MQWYSNVCILVVVCCWQCCWAQIAAVFGVLPEDGSFPMAIYSGVRSGTKNATTTRLNIDVPGVQKACTNALRRVIQDAMSFRDLDALRMLDSTAKLPAGLLSGNVNQYGDFDQCLAIQNGQYCLPELDISAWWQQAAKSGKNVDFSNLETLIHSYRMFKDTFDDPGHRVPGFSSIRWGFCIPSQCSAKDLDTLIEHTFGIKARTRPGMCQQRNAKDQPWTIGDYVSRFFFIVIFAAILIGTALDMNHSTRAEDKFRTILLAFSLKRNIRSVFYIKENTASENNDEIAGVHGVRALSAIALLLSHKSIALLFNPYTNRTPAVKDLAEPWTILAKNAIIYTDCFILISGILTSSTLLKDLIRHGRLYFGKQLISRILRITPNIVTIIMVCTYILPQLGSGPMWPQVIDHHSHLCKKYMWRNIFYVHNYFGFENMCLTHTHQVGIDMQLFLMSPLIVLLIWYQRKLAYGIIVTLAALSTVLRFWATWNYELSSIVYFGIPISRMFRTANYSYILPTHRATIYLMGLLLGAQLKLSKNQKNTTNNATGNLIRWSMFLIAFLVTWFGPYKLALIDYEYDKLQAAFIAALTPIFWGGSVAFLIYAINNNMGSIFKPFMCWKYFQVFTRIAYSLYLVQFPVYFFNVGLTRQPQYYKHNFLLDIVETSIIFILSFILTVSIELPFQNIKKLIFEENANCQRRDNQSDKTAVLESKPQNSLRKAKFG